ncbi:MAG TPA: hypothetical protein VFB96_21670 [Pirellulaceae bacterium]|nr:hypothetical protein [Pirellulaceae bacterium]
MQWCDDNQSGDEESAQPRIKPRRIDPPHPLASALETHAELPASVPAAVESGHEIAADDAPIFYELPRAELSSWEAAHAGETDIRDLTTAPDESPQTADDISLQTEQLADALTEQLGDLDQREASLSERAAELDRQWRDCQQWHQHQLVSLEQREAELSRREAEMEVFLRREEDLAQRLRDCEALELSLDRRQSDLNEREATLVARDHELRDRRQEVEREAAALNRSQQLWEQSKGRDEQALERERRRLQTEMDEEFAERRSVLDAEKSCLAEQARDLERDRQALRRERDAWHRERQQEDEQRAQQQRQVDQESEQRRSALTAREATLDTQQAAVEQLRNEVMAAYRQALEMRLIVEQLWAQLKGLMTPAEITQSLAQLRLKMAEQYELEEKSLGERKEELLALADKLAQQHATLKAQRMEFLAWRKSQQQEIAHQAEHLCRRVQELSEEKKRLRQAA